MTPVLLYETRRGCRRRRRLPQVSGLRHASPPFPDQLVVARPNDQTAVVKLGGLGLLRAVPTGNQPRFHVMGHRIALHRVDCTRTTVPNLPSELPRRAADADILLTNKTVLTAGHIQACPA